MRRFPLLPLVLAALVGSVATALGARADDPVVAEPPKPPTTPLPTFENPTHDCAVGETLLYAVRDLEGKWTRYFEERVIAKGKKKDDADDWVLVETVETDATGTKVWRIDNDNSGWRPTPKTFRLPDTCRWILEKQKDGVLYIGEPATKAVRVTHRFLEEPKDPKAPGLGKRVRQIWYSHDVPVTGRVKMFPAQQDGERMAISWDKRLTPEECAERAKRHPSLESLGAPTASSAEGAPPGMEGEPAMGEPGMSEPGMEGEPGMGEPGMDGGPAMDPEPGMDADGGMKD